MEVAEKGKGKRGRDRGRGTEGLERVREGEGRLMEGGGK